MLAAKAGLSRMDYHLKRTIEVGQTFRTYFARERIRPVFAVQFGGGLNEAAAALTKARDALAANAVYGLALAPYMSDKGSPASEVPQDHANYYVKKAQLWAAGQGDSMTALPQWAALANHHGLELLAYEAGLDPALGGTAKQVAARAAAQLLPGAGKATGIYLDTLFRMGVKRVVIYKDFSIYNKTGYYGLSNHPAGYPKHPKYKAAVAAAARFAVPDVPPATRPTTQPSTGPATGPTTDPTTQLRFWERLAAIESALPAVRDDSSAALTRAAEAASRVQALQDEVDRLKVEAAE